MRVYKVKYKQEDIAKAMEIQNGMYDGVPPITITDGRYSILRFYRDERETEVMATGLTLERAQLWCNSKLTSTPEYFDGYTDQNEEVTKVTWDTSETALTELR